jgi:hypothetical protein
MFSTGKGAGNASLRGTHIADIDRAKLQRYRAGKAFPNCRRVINREYRANARRQG